MKISDLEKKLNWEGSRDPASDALRFKMPRLSAEAIAWEAEKNAAPISTRDAVWKLTDATEELIASTERSSRLLIRLTMALVALTIAIVGLTALLVVLAL